MRIAVTGASGYVGGSILRDLRAAGHEAHAWSRKECPAPWSQFELASIPDPRSWQDFDALVHTAHDFSAIGWKENHRLNIAPSIALARSAMDAGIQKRLYLSSLSADEETRSIYGKTKLAVEKEWIEMGGIVIRAGLVWGSLAGGVMGAIENVVRRLPVVPMPVARRALVQFLVHERDLASAILCTLLDHSGSPLLLACHPEPMPLPALVKRIATARNLSRPCIPFPGCAGLWALRMLEKVKIPMPFRSDSLISLLEGYDHFEPAMLAPVSFRPFEVLPSAPTTTPA